MRLQFDPKPSRKYPNGYWYAKSEILGLDADGATPSDALAALVVAIEEGEEREERKP